MRRCYLVARDSSFEAIYGVTVYSTLWQFIPVFNCSWKKRINDANMMQIAVTDLRELAEMI